MSASSVESGFFLIKKIQAILSLKKKVFEERRKDVMRIFLGTDLIEIEGIFSSNSIFSLLHSIMKEVRQDSEDIVISASEDGFCFRNFGKFIGPFIKLLS